MTRINPLHPSMFKAERPTEPADNPDQRRRPQRDAVLNVPLLVWTVILWVAAAPAAYFWHRYQMRGSADHFLTQAQVFENKKEWRQAAQALDHYLKLEPADATRRVRLADDYAKSVTGPESLARAVELYRLATRALPKDLDVRKRLAETQLKLAEIDENRYQFVVQDAERVLQARPADATAHRLKALSLWGQAQHGKKISLEVVRQNLITAIKFLPHDIELSVQLSNLYRNEFPGIRKAEREALGRKVLDDLVQNNSSDPAAYLARFRYRVLDNAADADEDLKRALELDPRHIDSLLTAGGRAGTRGDLDQAREFFERAMEAKPEDPRPYLGLAETYAERGAYEKAIDVWRRGLDAVSPLDAAHATLMVRLAEGLLAANRIAELKVACDELAKQTAKFVGVVPLPMRLQMESRLLFLRGRVKMAEGDAFGALVDLRKGLLSQEVVTDTDQERRQRLQSAYYLGVCYGLLKQWDMAALAFEEAARYEPANPKYPLAAADAWDRAGQQERAIVVYEQALALRGTPPEVWVSLARMRFTQQVQLPAERRDWQPFRNALKNARRAVPEATSLQVLETDFANIMGERNDALAQLETAYAAAPDSESLGRARVLSYAQMGRSEESDKALAEYIAKHGEGLPTKKVQVALLMQRGQFAEAEKILQSAIPSAGAEDEQLLKYQLAMVYLRDGRADDGRQLLTALATANPANVSLLEQTVQLALDARDFADVQRWEQRLRDLEGPSGTLWRYYRAERLLAQAESPSDPKFGQAESLQKEITAIRPEWPPAYLLQAQMAEQREQRSAAIDAYVLAIDKGENRVTCYERLIHLLYDGNRFAEAEQYLTRLRNAVLNANQLPDVAISLLAEQGRVGQAISLAEKAAAQHSGEPQSRVWLGQALQLAGRTAEAEVAFRQAVERSPQDPKGWVALIGFFARQDRREAARAALDDLARYADLPSGVRLYVLAQGYEMVGDRQSAEMHYREALTQTPDNIDLLRRAAEFFSGVDDALAEESLQRLLALEPNSDDVRRRLISMLRSRGGERDWRKVVGLLERADTRQNIAAEEMRLRAQLLVQRGGEKGIQEAAAQLEELIRSHSSARPEDFIALAKLNELSGRLTRARELMLMLVSSKSPEPAHIAEFVDMLLRNDLEQDAATWLDQLERLDPNSFRTLALRVRWLGLSHQETEVESRVERFAAEKLSSQSTPREQALAAVQIAHIYDSVNMLAGAEKWYRRGYELSPLAYSPLATWLAAHQRADEGVNICLAVVGPTPVLQLGMTLATVLSWCNATPETALKAEPILAQAIEQHTRDENLLLAIGRLRYMQDRPEDAIELFRRVLELNAGNIEAMRLLALLLSEQPIHQGEALQLVRSAIAAAGEQEDLRDALGLVLLNQGQTNEAITVLRGIGDQASADARHTFHLALAYQQAGDRTQARKAIRQARDAQLDPLRLPVNERTRLEQLEASLRVNPG